MGIKGGCLTDGSGFTQDLADSIKQMLRDSYYEGTPEQTTEKWFKMLGMTYSEQLVAHTR